MSKILTMILTHNSCKLVLWRFVSFWVMMAFILSPRHVIK